jgi:hypothetical protein
VQRASSLRRLFISQKPGTTEAFKVALEIFAQPEQIEKFLFNEDDTSTRPEFHLFANTLYRFLDW